MKPTKEQIEAYKEMAKTSPDSMKAMIEANLKATCDKFAGHEDRLDDCIDYLTECAREILDHKNGEVDNETCYRICRDYFNDELWNVEEVKTKAEAAKIESKIQQAKFKKEKAAQAVKDAKAQEAKAKKEVKKAEKESSEFHRKEKRKYMEAMAKKVTQDFEKEQADKERERLEKLKEKHGLKAARSPRRRSSRHAACAAARSSTSTRKGCAWTATTSARCRPRRPRHRPHKSSRSRASSTFSRAWGCR